MTKNFLLAATAMTAIAFAGAAGAAEITSASVSGQALNPASATPLVYTVAQELITTTAAVANRRTTTTTGQNLIVASVSDDGAFGPGIGGRTYGATLTLAGATFQGDVADADVALIGAVGTCTTADTVIVDGGATGGTSVTVAITIPAGCAIADAPTGVSFDVPFTLNAAASTASASVAFVLGSEEVPFDGGAATVQLVRKVSAYDVSITADDATTVLALGDGNPPYIALLGDAKLGTVKVDRSTAPTNAAGATVYSALNATTAGFEALTFDVAAQASGNFDVIGLNLGATPFEVDEDDSSKAALTAQAAGTYDITAVIDPTNDVSITSAQSYAITVTPKVATGATVTAPAARSGAIETIGLEGTNFVAPWFTLNNANNTAFLRLSNNGTASTGPVFLSLKSANGAVTTAQVALTQSMLAEGTLASNGGIAANGAVLITGSALASAFGTTAANGDVQVTIQAEETNITAKTRVRTASGVVTETSLGRLGDTGVSF